jgi:5'(3')-deoxyribonucleotidase
MTEDRRFVLGIDLDGVCADFYEGLREVAAEWLGVPLDTLTRDVSYGLPEWRLDRCGDYDDLHRFAVTRRDLFRKLNPIHGAPATMRRLAHLLELRVRIITHRLFIPYFHKEAISQTVEWLDQHGIPYWDLCFMRDKAAVGADLYLEDSPTNVAKLRADKHDTIVFSNSTNRQVDDPRANSWDDVEALVARYVKKWEETAGAKVVAGT